MSKLVHYFFDVDGTLTKPRGKMDSSFTMSFLEWMENKSVFLVAGSDIDKVKQQLPYSVISRCAGIFCSMGNQFWIKDDLVYEKDWKCGIDLLNDLRSFRQDSLYANKKGKWLEHRTGMINFSIAGRDSNLEQREEYHKWDTENQERLNIVKSLSKKYDHLDFRIGGKISIDINPKGNNKSQASQWIRENLGGKIIFFGDSCSPEGNDYDIYVDVKENDGESYWVDSPSDTLKLLK